jgi:two-component system NtrC family response regulator
MIRVICVAHRDIEDMIQTQTFREDLYYRISDITLELPPLREREDDVLSLANAFLTKYSGQQGKSVKGLSPAADQVLLDYECKGNVRELERIIRRGVIFLMEQMASCLSKVSQ